MSETSSSADYSNHAEADPMGAEHDRLSLYLAVFVALCVLTACSFWTYSDLWPSALEAPAIKRAFMLAVSCTKAMLVILFFMHLKWEANWKWVLTIPALMMSIFLMLVLVPDIGLRMRHASLERLEYAAELPAEPDEAAELKSDHEAVVHP
jgi:cytochrome c oxidase subunit 4